MRNLFVICVLVLFVFLSSCSEKKAASSTADTVAVGSMTSEQTSSHLSSEMLNISLDLNGEIYSIKQMNEELSYLKFYSSDSDMNHDADLEIVSSDKSQRLTIIIDGLNAKGKDLVEGKVVLGENTSLINFKNNDTLISFSEGEIMVQEVSKSTGKISIQVKGLCSVKKGNSFKDMKLDIPGELTVDALVKDVKTLNYKKN